MQLELFCFFQRRLLFFWFRGGFVCVWSLGGFGRAVYLFCSRIGQVSVEYKYVFLQDSGYLLAFFYSILLQQIKGQFSRFFQCFYVIQYVCRDFIVFCLFFILAGMFFTEGLVLGISWYFGVTVLLNSFGGLKWCGFLSKVGGGVLEFGSQLVKFYNFKFGLICFLVFFGGLVDMDGEL